MKISDFRNSPFGEFRVGFLEQVSDSGIPPEVLDIIRFGKFSKQTENMSWIGYSNKKQNIRIYK